MIKVNTSALQASLEKAKNEIKRKLENMVKEFTYQSSVIFIDNTPYGDSDTYASLYNNPRRLAFFPSASEGSAKSGWYVGITEPALDPYPSPTTEDAGEIKDRARIDVREYRLGEKVFIANYVPYVASEGWLMPHFGSLEGGYSKSQAPQGIWKPSMVEIQRLLGQDLQRYYDSK